jgi:CPA2 family monovalent cation:H+ antiporter-2
MLGVIAAADTASVYLQLGAVLFLLGVAGRFASRVGLSPIPLYLLAGLVLGAFDIPALQGDFVRFAAGLGVILLLFVIGLEYTAEELSAHLRRFHRAGVLDAALNFPAGLVFGLLLGWDPVSAILLGGITWVSSSGIVAKALSDLGWILNRETRAIMSILVIEDLAMAGFLPLVASLLVGGSVLASARSLAIAGLAATAALIGAMRFGEALGRIVHHHSEEVVLLTAMGLVLVAAGVAEELQVSAAVGAFLVGIALSGEVAQRTRGLLSPIRDVNAALFFLFFALQINTAELPGVALPAVALAVLTSATKAFTGWRAAALAGADAVGRARAATALIARGEFSIVLAGLGASAGSGAAVHPQLAPLAACYVLILAIAGPVLMHFSDALAGIRSPAASRPASTPR